MQMNNPVPIFGANQASWFALFYKVNYATIFNLLLFIGLMVGAYYLSKYFLSKSPYSAPHHTGKVKERLYVGHQSSMTVVELQGVYYVLVNDKGRTTLIDKRDNLEYPVQESTVKVPEFGEVLKNILKKNNQ
jgi:flagellar biogenesis protein FliO